MPNDQERDPALPPRRWNRLRATLTVALAVAWLPVLLYALHVSDDRQEKALNLVLLALGLLAAALASTHRLRASRLRLHRAERRIEAMSSADVLPWECDREGRITYVGARVREHFGYTPVELTGSSVRDLVHPQEYARLAAYLAAGAGWRNERWRCVLKDGTERWFAGSAMPNIASDGKLWGYTGSSHPLGRDALDEHRLSEIAGRVYDRLDSGDILPVFQPILSVATGRLVGAEALTRFPGSDLTPDRWFGDAAEVGIGVELELAALRKALFAAQQLPEDIYVSVNVGPHTLVRPGIFETLTRSPIDPDRIVLEITEHASINEYDEVLIAVQNLRARGVRLAVDDAGAGYASFRHILRLTPEIIKLDRSLVAGLHDDPGRRALAAAVVAFGSQMHATITAEGIETPEELRCLQTLGIHAAQGYLFGRPTAEWSTWNEWHRHGPLYSVTAAGMPLPREA